MDQPINLPPPPLPRPPPPPPSFRQGGDWAATSRVNNASAFTGAFISWYTRPLHPFPCHPHFTRCVIRLTAPQVAAVCVRMGRHPFMHRVLAAAWAVAARLRAAAAALDFVCFHVRLPFPPPLQHRNAPTMQRRLLQPQFIMQARAGTSHCVDATPDALLLTGRGGVMNCSLWVRGGGRSGFAAHAAALLLCARITATPAAAACAPLTTTAFGSVRVLARGTTCCSLSICGCRPSFSCWRCPSLANRCSR